MSFQPARPSQPPLLASEHELRERLRHVNRVLAAIRGLRAAAGPPTRPSRTEGALVFMMLWGMLDYVLERSPLHPDTEALIDSFCGLQDPWILPESFARLFWEQPEAAAPEAGPSAASVA